MFLSCSVKRAMKTQLVNKKMNSTFVKNEVREKLVCNVYYKWKTIYKLNQLH